MSDRSNKQNRSRIEHESPDTHESGKPPSTAQKAKQIIVNNSLDQLRECVAVGSDLLREMLRGAAFSEECGHHFRSADQHPLPTLEKLAEQLSQLKAIFIKDSAFLPAQEDLLKLEQNALEATRNIIKLLPELESELISIVRRAADNARRFEQLHEEDIKEQWSEDANSQSFDDQQESKTAKLASAIQLSLLQTRLVLELALDSYVTILEVGAGCAALGYQVSAPNLANKKCLQIVSNQTGVAIRKAISIVESARDQLATKSVLESLGIDGDTIPLSKAQMIWGSPAQSNTPTPLIELAKAQEPITLVIHDDGSALILCALPGNNFKLPQLLINEIKKRLSGNVELFEALGMTAEATCQLSEELLWCGLKIALPKSSESIQPVLQPKSVSDTLIKSGRTTTSPGDLYLRFHGAGSLAPNGTIELCLTPDVLISSEQIGQLNSALRNVTALAGRSQGTASARVYPHSDLDQDPNLILGVNRIEHSDPSLRFLGNLHLLQMWAQEASIIRDANHYTPHYSEQLYLDKRLILNIELYKQLYSMLSSQIRFRYLDLIELSQARDNKDLSDAQFSSQLLQEFASLVEKTRNGDNSTRYLDIRSFKISRSEPAKINVAITDERHVLVGRAYCVLRGDRKPSLDSFLEIIPSEQLAHLTTVLHQALVKAFKDPDTTPSGSSNIDLYVARELELNGFRVSHQILNPLITFYRLTPQASVEQLRNQLNLGLVESGVNVTIAPCHPYQLAILTPNDRAWSRR
ncbi:MAG: hypothetical protein ACK5Y6_07310 [Pseudomonadota bacterium]